MPTADRDYDAECPKCKHFAVRILGIFWSCFQCGSTGSMKIKGRVQ